MRRTLCLELLLATMILLGAPASAATPPENLIPRDKDGHFVNDFTELFNKTGARPAEWRDSNKDRLAVVYYAHRGWRMHGVADMGVPSVLNTRSLNCSIIMLMRNLAPFTPLDVIVVTSPEHIERDGFPDWLARRITHQFHLIRALGYRYLLQHDDDAFEVVPFNHSIVDVMRQKKQVMGGWCRHCAQEDWAISRAGPELMRFFMIAKQIRQPKGDLLQHCVPPNVSGLYTWRAYEFFDDPGPQTGGWDRTQLAGNWNLFDIDFWFQEDVQDFIRLVIDSDQMFEARWNELMPQSMVEQLFVGPDEFYMAPTGAAVHISHWDFPPGFCVDALGVPADDLVFNRIDGKGPKLNARGQVVLENGTAVSFDEADLTKLLAEAGVAR